MELDLKNLKLKPKSKWPSLPFYNYNSRSKTLDSFSCNNNHQKKSSPIAISAQNGQCQSFHGSRSRHRNSSSSECEPSNLLVPALTLAQKILLVPFQLKYSHRLNEFHVKINFRQKVLVAFLSLVSTVQIVWEMAYYARLKRGKLGRNGQEKWAMYAIYTTWWLYHVAIVSIFWLRSSQLVDLINQIRHVCSILRRNGVEMCPGFCRWFPWFLLPTAIAWELFYYTIIDYDFEKYGWTSIVSSYLTRGTNVYFMREHGCTGPSTPTLTESGQNSISDWLNVIAGGFYMICLIYSNLLTNFGQYFVLLASLSTWILVRSYIHLLWKNSKGQNASPVQTQQILDMYDELCKLFELVNESIGDVIALTCLAMLPFYSLKLIDLFDGEWKFKLQYLYYAANFGGILFPAAGSNSMIRGIIPWLRTQEAQNNNNLRLGFGSKSQSKFKYSHFDHEKTPRVETLEFYQNQNGDADDWSGIERSGKDLRFRINLIVHELSGNCVGIKGRFFRISFAFVGNILSLIGTYAVIFFQFRSYDVSKRSLELELELQKGIHKTLS